jgi:hypothetical protein
MSTELESQLARIEATQPDPQDPFAATKERERELSAIVTDMWHNAETLVRQELELGLLELDLRVAKLKRSLLLASIGGAVVYGGVMVLLAALVLGLSKVMEPWLAALVVGAVLTASGATFLLRGEEKAVEAVKPVESSHHRTMKEATK